MSKAMDKPHEQVVTGADENNLLDTGYTTGIEHQSTSMDVEVHLQYLAQDPVYQTVKPVQITPNFLDANGKSNTNVILEPGPRETINDIRGHQDDFTLDKNGFAFVKAPTSFIDWTNQPAIGRDYLNEMEALLKREVSGCDEIIFYDARLRHSGPDGARVSGLSFNPFARQVHLDNTEKSVLEKIRDLTELKADFLLLGRSRIINIWRPINHPVYDCGLAVADAVSLKSTDIIECERRRHDTGAYWDTMGVVHYRPGFAWYYQSHQTPSDVLLFKNYDSDASITGRHCLHTAFDLPADSIPTGAPTRESIEVRALVFTHPPSSLPNSIIHTTLDAKIPHPLALSLAENALQPLDDPPNLSSTTSSKPLNYARTDIDEAHELKDAELLLRQREIESLRKENKKLARKLVHTQEELHARNEVNEALETYNAELEKQLSYSSPSLRNQIADLRARLFDVSTAHKYEHGMARDEEDGLQTAKELWGEDAEVVLLRQWVVGLEAECRKWKTEAEGRGSESVSWGWEKGVQEAVRREREKDCLVVERLKGRVEELEACLRGMG